MANPKNKCSDCRHVDESHKEMFEDFKEDIEESEFVLYFRRAISKYEGHDEWI